jgi:hypothetical protein
VPDIVRGEAGPTSDLDVFVIHDEPWRIREQRRLPVCRLSCSSTRRGRSAVLRREHARGRPSTAHMFATGE